MADEEDEEKKDSSESDDSAKEKGNGNGEEKGEKKEKGGGKKQKFKVSKKALIIGGIALAVLLVGALLYWLHARHFESTDDAYTTAHVHNISARVAGTVETLNVRDNQLVHAGDPLLTLDQRDFKVAVEHARAEVAQARAQILQRGAAADQAQANLDRAQTDFDRVTALYQKDAKAVSKADVDNATAALKSARGMVDAAKADLSAAQAALAADEAALSNAELQLSYTVISAPVEGVIGKRSAESGQRIQPGQALMAVVERNVWVLANFKETQLAQVRVGQHADVEVDAVPDHVFSAHVDSFQPGTGSAFALLPPDNATGNFTKIVQRVPVKLVFDDLGQYRERVVPGLSCVPKIDLRTGPQDHERAH